MEADKDYIELRKRLSASPDDSTIIAELEAKESEYKAQLQTYESNELIFTNESDVIDYTSLDLISGLITVTVCSFFFFPLLDGHQYSLVKIKYQGRLIPNS